MFAATADPVALVATKSPEIVAVKTLPVVLLAALSVAPDEKVAAILPVVSSDVNVILPETLSDKPKLATECFPDPNVAITQRLVSESDIAELTSIYK